MIVLACVAAVSGLAALPVGPRGHVNHRDYTATPRWQVELFNAAVVVPAFLALVVTVLAVITSPVAPVLAIVVGAIEALAVGGDLTGAFPRGAAPMPGLLRALEITTLALAIAMIVLGIVAANV